MHLNGYTILKTIPASSDSSLKAYTATSGTIVEFMVFGTQA